jgi:ATP-dependent protease ClpP protease subunit
MINTTENENVNKVGEEEDKNAIELNFMESNNIFINGDFDDSIMKNIIPKLLKEIDIQADKKTPKIKIYIDSRGGYVNVLLNLLALIEIAKKKDIIIETYVFSRAYSCGSILACAGTKGNRYISYNAEHLCHLGMGDPGQVINDTELERGAERIKFHFDRIRMLYKKYADVLNLEEVIKNDNYFIRGNDIIKNGLADKYVD